MSETTNSSKLESLFTNFPKAIEKGSIPSCIKVHYEVFTKIGFAIKRVTYFPGSSVLSFEVLIEDIVKSKLEPTDFFCNIIKTELENSPNVKLQWYQDFKIANVGNVTFIGHSQNENSLCYLVDLLQ